MPLRYSCFISYRHGQGQIDIVKELVESLKTELSLWLELEELGVFLDEGRLKGGEFFNEKLARALCESVCLIVVFTPTYFSEWSTFCAREYKAMERLEKKRLPYLSKHRNEKGLIIPIVYRGDKDLPDSIRKKRQYYTVESFHISGRGNSDNPEYAKIIKEIGEYIRERCDDLRVVEDIICEPCDTFDFPEEDEISDWLKTMLPPKPSFPGRKTV